MPPPRPAMEARSGSLEPCQPRHPAGRPHTPPADWLYATDVRQHHCLMPLGGRIIISPVLPKEIHKKTVC